jgi:copper chaperone CopZ
MKKKYVIEDLCCANCAAKMEDAIKKIEGVNDAAINFMAQKLTIDAADDRFDAIMKEVKKTIAKIEPDCTLID